ncbi:unnamed protein product [Caenorhabditis auriculariae]|uniref:Uncharacterized protein n=1 Tax=Caenorhabditis auriculariae TaxID=2777116 RepID=A0A8S1GNA3_9PELO|nr:unnamed protein product [Caenorhabditis auriculariae]
MSARFYDDQQEFMPRPNGYATYSGHENHPNGGILRNKDTYARPQSVLPRAQSFGNESEDSASSCQSFVDNLLRPCFAEFLAVFITTFLTIHINTELNDRHVLSVYRIVLLSTTDAIAALVFISAFKTYALSRLLRLFVHGINFFSIVSFPRIHLHSAITLAHLFCLTTSWYICVFLFLVQFFGSIAAVLASAAIRSSDLPPVPVFSSDISSEWSKSAYKLVNMISQFIGTLMVVMSHVLSHESLSKNSMRVGRLRGSALALFMSIAMSSFLSHLQSTIGWNSMVTTAIAVSRAMSNVPEYPQQLFFHEHFVFWLGPVIASLTASFLYRLLYAPDNKKISCGCCDDYEVRPINV